MKTPSPALRSHWPQQAFVTIVTLIGLAWVAGSYGYYRSELEETLQVEHQTLDAIGRLKSAQIEHWRAERLADATRVASNLALRQETELLLRDPARQDRLAEMQQRLQVEKMVSVYSSVLLIDPRQQTVLAGSDIREPFDAATQSLVAAAIAGNDAVISSFFRDSKGIVSIDVAVALRNAGRKPLAVVILRSRAQDYLYPLIQASSELRSSGETLLFERSPTDVVRLSDPRGRSGLALSQHIPLSRTDVAAVRAALGQQGRFQGLDDRGEPVLADLRWIPGSPWFMVAKLDLEEVVEKTRYQVALVSAIVGLSILLAAGAIAWVYRKRQSGILQNLFESERQQWEAREFFRTTLYGIGDAVITADVTGRLRAMNPVAERLTGWTEMQALGKPIAEVFRIVDAATRDEPECRITSVLRNGQVLRLADNMLLIAKDGTERPIAESAAPIRDHRGVISGVVLVFSDQVEPHTARLALGEREERLRLALSAAKQGLFDLNVQTGDATVNSEYATMLGFDPAEFRETHDAWIERLHPDDRTRVAGLYEDYIAGRRDDYQVEFRQRTKSGEWKWVLSLGSVVTLSADGRPLRMLGTHTDITERKRVIEALRQSEENLAITLQSIGDAVIATDPQGRITRMNDTAARMTGWSFTEAAGRPLSEVFQIVDALTLKPVMNPVQQVLTRQEIIELSKHTTLVSRSGAQYQIADSAAPIRDQAGKVVGVVLVFSDISEQYRVQQALRDREQRLRTIIETEPECVKVVDHDGTLLEMNPAGLAMLEAESLAEARHHTLLNFILPEYRRAFIALHQRVMRGESGQLSFEIVGLRGTRRWLETHAAPMRDASGTVAMLLGVTREITERKRAEVEKERLEAQLRQSQKMDAVGQLAGGVAHDFNNLLTVIIGRAELVLADLPESHPMRPELQQIHSAGERAAALTGKLLAFSRKQIIQLEELELNALIEGLQLMLRRLIREDIELVVVPAAGLGRVKADRGQLEQVVMNLAINARDAMPGGGTLTIETQNVDLDKAFAVGLPTITPGPHVMFALSDTGIGIDQAILARIFEPFFTTKEVGHGTGLGLSTVYGIVTQCGGAIDVQSEPGKGSTFRVYLPRTESETPKEPAERILSGSTVPKP